MYDELVKRLWECASGECFNCSQYKPTTNASVCQKELMKQAADAIEERCKQVDKFAEEVARLYAKQPKWIPVTERLPDAGRYLALTPPFTNGGKPVARILHFSKNLESVDRYDFEGINRSGWYYYDDEYGNIEVDTVTHWMPLPTPPKEE